MRKQILLIYTGGTIGMIHSREGYSPASGLQALIDAKIPPIIAVDMPRYDLLEYADPLDSSDMQPPDWQTIALDIHQRYQDYDGFVVLHGTDTMAYTTSALSFMLQGLGKPVIVTGSQIPLTELRNDAQTNLVTAFELASAHPIPEVCLYFNDHLLRGNRAIKQRATGFEAFTSPNYPELADVGIYIALNRSAILPAPEKTNFSFPDYRHHQVRVLNLYPGIQADVVNAVCKPPCRALILRTYGVGNGPASDKSLLKALEAANKAGIVIISVTQCASGGVTSNAYASGSRLAATGMISAKDMTLEAAFTKLHHLCASGCSAEEMKSLLPKSFAGEVSP